MNILNIVKINCLNNIQNNNSQFFAKVREEKNVNKTLIKVKRQEKLKIKFVFLKFICCRGRNFIFIFSVVKIFFAKNVLILVINMRFYVLKSQIIIMRLCTIKLQNGRSNE